MEYVIFLDGISTEYTALRLSSALWRSACFGVPCFHWTLEPRMRSQSPYFSGVFFVTLNGDYYAFRQIQVPIGFDTSTFKVIYSSVDSFSATADSPEDLLETQLAQYLAREDYRHPRHLYEWASITNYIMTNIRTTLQTRAPEDQPPPLTKFTLDACCNVNRPGAPRIEVLYDPNAIPSMPASQTAVAIPESAPSVSTPITPNSTLSRNVSPIVAAALEKTNHPSASSIDPQSESSDSETDPYGAFTSAYYSRHRSAAPKP